MSEENKNPWICPKCGRKNEAENSHCKYCGWPKDVRILPDD